MADDLERFMDCVKNRAGLSHRAPVEHAVHTTLLTLGGLLNGVPPALHDALPAYLRVELATGQGVDPLLPAALYQRIAEHGELKVGAALELVQSTLAELSEQLFPPAREALRESLPPAWAALITGPREHTRPMPWAACVPKTREHSLASGRPGAMRPLSTATLPAGQADSIATSSNPHATRMANAKGSGPRESTRTLAEGRPGSLHSVAEAD